MINRVDFCTNLNFQNRMNQNKKLQSSPVSFKRNVSKNQSEKEGIKTQSGISTYIPNYSWNWEDFSGTEKFSRYVDIKKINLLGGNESHLKNMAEYLWNVPDEEIKNHFAIQKGFLGFTSKEKTNQAYQRIIPFVREVRKKVFDLSEEKKELELKKLNGVSDLTEQKKEISRAFTLMDMNDKENADFPYLNGILLYGDSEGNKESLYSWIRDNTGLLFEEVQYDASVPRDSFSSIISALEKAQKAYELTGVRTIIALNDIDKLLTDYSTRQRRQLIGMFKSLVEVAAQKYHTTFLIKTSSNIEDFEPASIGGQRFKLINLDKQNLSDDEEERLKVVTTELERLNDKSKKLINDFTYVVTGYSMDENDFTRFDD